MGSACMQQRTEQFKGVSCIKIYFGGALILILLCMQLEQYQTPTLLRTPQGATSPAPAQTVLSRTLVMAAKSRLAKGAMGWAAFSLC